MLLRRVGKFFKTARRFLESPVWSTKQNPCRRLLRIVLHPPSPPHVFRRKHDQLRGPTGPQGPPSRWLTVEKVNDAPTHPGYRWQPQSQVSLSRYEATRSDRDDHSLILFPEVKARWPTAKACLSSMRTLGLHVLFFQQRSGVAFCACIVFTVCQGERRSGYIWPLN